MFGIQVVAKLTPASTDLLAWGRAPGGSWWALLEWTVAVHSTGVQTAVHCSAWCPASTVFPSGYHRDADYKWVLRLRLPDDRDSWPRLWFYDNTPTYHYGVLTVPAGDAPPGYRRFGGRRDALT